MSATGKGQTSMEFMVMVAVMLFVFTVTVSMVGDRHLLLTENRMSLQALSVADKVGYELDLALTQGEGFSHGFELRPSIATHNYSVLVGEGFVRINWSESTVFSSTAVDSVEGSFKPGYNRIVNTGEGLKVVG